MEEKTKNAPVKSGARPGRTVMATKDAAKKGAPEYVESKWYVADGEGMPLGRLASQVAAVLRGKNKPVFTPNVDCGDHVIVINCDKVVLTGKKMEQKMKRTHSGYMGATASSAWSWTAPRCAISILLKSPASTCGTCWASKRPRL